MAAENRQKLLVVLGPTATGKTALAIRLAQQLGGEIVSADSMQIYRGLDVGTAKATPAERAAVPHHLIDICDPQQSFSVADYVACAKEAVAGIAARGRLPIVAGGTGLYLSSLLDGLSFAAEPQDDGIRARLAQEAEALGEQAMYDRLARLDPQSAAATHPHNRKRVLRALELYEKTGRTMSEQRAVSRPAQRPYDALLLGLDLPRPELYARIDARVQAMMAAGLMEEARRVYAHRDSWKTAAQAISYKELFPAIEGSADEATCVEKLCQATRNYAKRQLTWFRRMEGVQWLNAAAPQPEGAVQTFLHSAGSI